MDNICLLGIGLVGLIYLGHNNSNDLQEKIQTNKVSVSEPSKEVAVIDTNNSLEKIGELLNNSQFKIHDTINNTVKFEIPINDVTKYDLHPFMGFDHITMSETEQVFGRYIYMDSEFENKISKLDVSFCHRINYVDKKESLILVKVFNNSIILSAIILDFIETVNRDLSICRMKAILNKRLHNFKISNVIDPPIPWFNLPKLCSSLKNFKNNNLEKNNTEATSLFNTDEIINTEDLDSNTSTMMDESMKMDNKNSEPLLEEDSSTNNLSDTSMNENMIIYDSSHHDTDLSDTSENNIVLEEMSDEMDEEMSDEMDDEIKSVDEDVSTTSEFENNVNIDDLSDTSYDKDKIDEEDIITDEDLLKLSDKIDNEELMKLNDKELQDLNDKELQDLNDKELKDLSDKELVKLNEKYLSESNQNSIEQDDIDGDDTDEDNTDEKAESNVKKSSKGKKKTGKKKASKGKKKTGKKKTGKKKKASKGKKKSKSESLEGGSSSSFNESKSILNRI